MKYTLNIKSKVNNRFTTKSYECDIPEEENEEAIELLKKLKKWTGINMIYLQRTIDIN